jgi:hypothetical protein
MPSILDIFKSTPKQGSGGYSEHPKEVPKESPKEEVKEGATITGAKAILGRKKQIDDAISEAGG